MATLKSAIHIQATETNPKRWQQIEEEELALLERILSSQQEKQPEVKPTTMNPTSVEETKEAPTFKPHPLKPDQGKFEKIVARLLVYNEKIN